MRSTIKMLNVFYAFIVLERFQVHKLRYKKKDLGVECAERLQSSKIHNKRHIKNKTKKFYFSCFIPHLVAFLYLLFSIVLGYSVAETSIFQQHILLVDTYTYLYVKNCGKKTKSARLMFFIFSITHHFHSYSS